MKRFFKSGAGATVLWLIASLLLAGLVAPWLYQAGKWLAHRGETEDLPRFFEWLAVECAHAKLSRYFSRSLLLSAMLLLPFLLKRVRAVSAAEALPPPERVRIPWGKRFLQIAVGFAIAGGILWGIGMLLDFVGAYHARPKQPSAGNVVGKIWLATVMASCVEEWLFRGLLLGLWLRFTRSLYACLGTSLLFAVIHFLEVPQGKVIANPASPFAGLELLSQIVYHFAEPLFFVTDFATLFCIGMILAWSRLRTGGLWFGIGLHAGWIAAFKGYNLLYTQVERSPWHPWGVGESLRSGLVPMCALLVTAFVCHFAMKGWDRNPKPLIS